MSASVDCGVINGEFVIDGENWKAADVIIVARGFPTSDTIDLIRAINVSRKRLVYETDDALPLIGDHHQKPWYKDAAPYIFECARLASVVTVSTAPLAQLFTPVNESVEVIVNQLDPRIWKPGLCGGEQHAGETTRIGIVASKHHERDLDVLRDVISTVTNEHKSVFWIGYGDGAGDLLNSLPRSRFRVVPTNYDYQSHPERLASLRVDIGLCPLLDDDFNRCKSDIKFLEFGFLGICGIYSKLPPYESSVSHRVNGLLCEWSADAWHEMILTLIADSALRDQISRNAQADVQSRILSCENNRWNQVLARFA